MKLLFNLAVMLVGVVAVSGFLFGDIIQCTFGPAVCSGALAELNSVGATTSNCSVKEPYFKCLRDNGCGSGSTFYSSQKIAFEYESCGSSQLAFSGLLCIAMVVLSKISSY